MDAAGVASLRSESALSQTEPLPASSAADPLQAKVEPISKVGDSSVKYIFNKGQKCHTGRRGEKKVRNNLDLIEKHTRGNI